MFCTCAGFSDACMLWSGGLLVPASEKRQGTKSREVEWGRCSGLYGDLACGTFVTVDEWWPAGAAAGRACWYFGGFSPFGHSAFGDLSNVFSFSGRAAPPPAPDQRSTREAISIRTLMHCPSLAVPWGGRLVRSPLRRPR
jgi:hypothetical protein